MHLTVRWIHQGRRGCINFETNEITLKRSMPFEERRCVVSHELVHDERGPVPRWLEPREEAAVRAESARRLIDVTELVDVLRWTPFIEEAAHELRVDVSTLQARLVNLTDPERSVLDAALGGSDEHDGGVPHVGHEAEEVDHGVG